ncbi:MAG: hypothetical protein IJ504_00890 [Bacteroidales bacterium]|nr:hypothetical protein [Bacteroidales bacterium]
MRKFNFKSQNRTNEEQSQRLLALGLKKETADFVAVYSLTPTDVYSWSFHRLAELLPEEDRGTVVQNILEEYPFEKHYDEIINAIEYYIRECMIDQNFLNLPEPETDNIPKCKACGGKLSLVSRTFNFNPDPEPFESGREEDIELKYYTAELTAMVCVNCGKMTEINHEK